MQKNRLRCYTDFLKMIAFPEPKNKAFAKPFAYFSERH